MALLSVAVKETVNRSFSFKPDVICLFEFDACPFIPFILHLSFTNIPMIYPANGLFYRKRGFVISLQHGIVGIGVGVVATPGS